MLLNGFGLKITRLLRRKIIRNMLRRTYYGWGTMIYSFYRICFLQEIMPPPSWIVSYFLTSLNHFKFLKIFTITKNSESLIIWHWNTESRNQIWITFERLRKSQLNHVKHTGFFLIKWYVDTFIFNPSRN